MNQKHLTIAIIVLYTVTLLFAVMQYQEKKAYEGWISRLLFNNLQILVIAIENNDYLYQEILNTGIITKKNAELLAGFNSDILMKSQELRAMAYEFRRLKTVQLHTNPTAKTAQGISKLFSGYSELNKIDNNLLEIDDILREKIEHLYYLNSLWLNSVQKNIKALIKNGVGLDTSAYKDIYGQHSLSRDFWIKLIIDMEYDTESFLKNHSIVTIDELLVNSR